MLSAEWLSTCCFKKICCTSTEEGRFSFVKEPKLRNEKISLTATVAKF